MPTSNVTVSAPGTTQVTVGVPSGNTITLVVDRGGIYQTQLDAALDDALALALVL